MPSFQTLRVQYSLALKRFAESPQNFEVITSVPHQPSSSSIPEVLYVLDSSFNPPTLAHRSIATSALRENPRTPSRLLLLLATQNADKPSKPASFEDRLTMMELFAHGLLADLKPVPDHRYLSGIDIGVTKKPYFVDKAAEIESAGYYPPEHTLRPLGPFLSKHRLRVTMRPDTEWGTRAEQEAYLLTLAQGGMDDQGANREWAQRIRLVEGKTPGERSVSSTRAREAILAHPHDLEWLVLPEIRDFVISERPYAE
ncbi:hypothetical protein AOCH_000924 [Aspergillus ochraceoroseus]|uniref:Cytidyltransferase-like domain-containing protein n=1 Tax=Aspergillus ochraceoroseus TaxID=138278 RepID=A0A0F8X6X6_9EURO|nr:hypothetical protein AOCH_000924 [Aspergillus ochraceoroseus]